MFSRPRFFYGLVRLARSLAAASVLLPVAVVAAGCVAHRGYAPVGTGQVVAAGGAPASAAPGSGALSPTVLVPDDLPDADLRIDYMIWLPRAMEVTWQVTCGEASVSGAAGESFEAYRVRRLAELRAERERAQRQAAQVGSLIGGAVLGQQAAVVSTGGPAANAQAGVVVDGAAVGAAAGAATVSTDVALAPDDVGAGYRKGSVELSGVPAGACRMEVAPRAPDDAAAGGAAEVALAIDPALLTGTFSVSRRDDPARRRALIAARGAIELRGALRTSLVAAGADADLEAARARNRARAEAAAAARREAEEALAARARVETEARRARERARLAEREARAQAELSVRLELEARARLEAEARWHAVIHTRGEVIAYLGRCGADPDHRERVAEERRARAELELQLAARRQRLALDLRGRLHATLIAGGADPGLRARLAAEAELAARARAEERARAAQARADHQAALAAEAVRRAEASAQVRAEVSAALVAAGARVRPPMPPPIDENPGLPPGSDATWVAGHWVWSGLAWEWSAGGWLGGATILPGVTVVVGGSVGGAPLPLPDPRPLPPPGYQPPPPPPSPATYVAPPAPPARDQVRDHRNGGSAGTVAPPPPPPPAPTPAPAPKRPKVRDHRDGS